MFKKIAKILSLVVILTLVLSTIAPELSKAAGVDNNVGKVQSVEIGNQPSVDVKVIEDSATQRVVETSDDTGNYRSTFNKKTSELITETLDTNGNVISSHTINNSQDSKPIEITPFMSVISSNADRTGEYKYYQYTDSIWVLMIPSGSKAVTQNPKTNQTQIYNFRSSVNSLRDAQNAFLVSGVGTMSGTALAVATVSGPWGWALAALTALGLTANQLYQGSRVNAAANDCVFWFGQTALK